MLTTRVQRHIVPDLERVRQRLLVVIVALEGLAARSDDDLTGDGAADRDRAAGVTISSLTGPWIGQRMGLSTTARR